MRQGTAPNVQQTIHCQLISIPINIHHHEHPRTCHRWLNCLRRTSSSAYRRCLRLPGFRSIIEGQCIVSFNSWLYTCATTTVRWPTITVVLMIRRINPNAIFLVFTTHRIANVVVSIAVFAMWLFWYVVIMKEQSIVESTMFWRSPGWVIDASNEKELCRRIRRRLSGRCGEELQWS